MSEPNTRAGTETGSLLRIAIILQLRNHPRAPACARDMELEEVTENGIDLPLPPNDPQLRAQLRLILKTVVDSMRASRFDQEYHDELRRVPRVNSAKKANAASNRLWKISAWEVQESGDGAGQPYRHAARIAEILLENYTDGGHQESYADVAALFLGAVSSDVKVGMVTAMLDGLQTA
ncbi:hypothetical protein [Streptomyces sp. NPDC054838]